MILTKDHIDILQGTIGEQELAAALDIMLQDHAFDLEAFEEFLSALHKADGDMSVILSRTHEPVDLETFVTDSHFLGMQIVDLEKEATDDNNNRVGVWRAVFDAANEVVSGNYLEALLMGAIGIGKTTMAQIICGYNIYKLSCEKWPQYKFGLMPGSSMVQVCLNVTDSLAKDVTYGEYRSLLEGVPYFQQEFPLDPQSKSTMRFPHNLRVEYHAAYNGKILGKNIIGGIVDELNFMQVLKESKKSVDGGEFHQAQKIYTTLVRRLKSRYDVIGEDGTVNKDIPATVCLVSSKGYPGDFTEQRKLEVEAENDGLTFIFDKAQWEVRPKASFARGGHFYVEVGAERYPSRILGKKEAPRKDAEIIKIPNFFKSDFQKDLEGALRDFAGRATDTKNAYFYDREAIWRMQDYAEELGIVSPFLDQVVDLEAGMPRLNDDFVVVNPERQRAAHIDLGLTRDFCGVAVGHVVNVSTGRTLGEDGRYSVEELPHVAYDMIIGIRPPKKGQIEFAEVRQLIYFLREELGIPIKWVTYDGFESVDSRQILRRKGYKTDKLSVESLDSYSGLRTAMFFQRRIACPEHERCFTELSRLEADFEQNRIDHPPGGSKDCADAMCGVYNSLSMQRSSWSNALRVGTETAAPMSADDWEKAVATQSRGAVNGRKQRRASSRRTRR